MPVAHYIHYSNFEEFKGIYIYFNYRLNFVDKKLQSVLIIGDLPTPHHDVCVDDVCIKVRLDIEDKSCFLHDLYVSPSFRRKGIATSLIRQCEQIAYINGATKLCLNSEIDNTIANTLYRKLGYSNSISKKYNLLNWEKQI